MDILFAALAVIGGAAMSVQAGVNSQLQANWAGSSLVAAMVSFAVGTLALTLCVLLTRTPIPALAGKTVWWNWTGGFLGAYLVAVTAFLAPRLGAALMVAYILAGQVGGSLILDHYGLVGYAQKTVTPVRLVGVVLVGLGVWCIRR